MFRGINPRLFVIFAITAVAMLLLAAGVAGILTPPESFAVAGESAAPLPGSMNFRISADGRWVIYIFIAIYILTLITILITPDGRKRFLGMFILLTAAVLALILLPRREPLVEDRIELPETTSQVEVIFDEPVEEATAVPGVIEAPQMSFEWLVTLAGIILAAGFVAFLVLVVVLILQRLNPSSITDDISRQAQSALDDLEMGGDYRDTIIRCYAEMSKTIIIERGIERSTGMTPREFEGSLVRMGFPEQPVRDLTHMFEDVRYGGHAKQEEKIELAKTSLRKIIAYCANTSIHGETAVPRAEGIDA